MPAVVIPPAGGYPIGAPVTDSLVGRQPAVFLADAIDPTTGEYRSILRGVDPLEARLLEKIRVRRASGSAVLTDGQRFDRVRFVDDNAESDIRAEVEYAWRDEIAARDIEITEYNFEPDNDSVAAEIHFKNLRFGGKPGKIELPLLALQGRIQ